MADWISSFLNVRNISVVEFYRCVFFFCLNVKMKLKMVVRVKLKENTYKNVTKLNAKKYIIISAMTVLMHTQSKNL